MSSPVRPVVEVSPHILWTVCYYTDARRNLSCPKWTEYRGRGRRQSSRRGRGRPFRRLTAGPRGARVGVGTGTRGEWLRLQLHREGRRVVVVQGVEDRELEAPSPSTGSREPTRQVV